MANILWRKVRHGTTWATFWACNTTNVDGTLGVKVTAVATGGVPDFTGCTAQTGDSGSQRSSPSALNAAFNYTGTVRVSYAGASPGTALVAGTTYYYRITVDGTDVVVSPSGTATPRYAEGTFRTKPAAGQDLDMMFLICSQEPDHTLGPLLSETADVVYASEWLYLDDAGGAVYNDTGYGGPAAATMATVRGYAPYTSSSGHTSANYSNALASYRIRNRWSYIRRTQAMSNWMRDQFQRQFPMRFIHDNHEIWTAASSLAITGVTDEAADCQVTTSTAHGYSAGQRVWITGVSGATQINDQAYTLTSASGSTFTIGVSSVGWDTYTSGGRVCHAMSRPGENQFDAAMQALWEYHLQGNPVNSDSLGDTAPTFYDGTSTTVHHPYFSEVTGDVEVIVLDQITFREPASGISYQRTLTSSDRGSVATSQLAWATSKIANTTAKFLIVFIGRPYYQGETDYENVTTGLLKAAGTNSSKTIIFVAGDVHQPYMRVLRCTAHGGAASRENLGAPVLEVALGPLEHNSITALAESTYSLLMTGSKVGGGADASTFLYRPPEILVSGDVGITYGDMDPTGGVDIHNKYSTAADRERTYWNHLKVELRSGVLTLKLMAPLRLSKVLYQISFAEGERPT